MMTCADAPVWMDVWTDKQSVGADLCEIMGADYAKRPERSPKKVQCLIALLKEKCFFFFQANPILQVVVFCIA